MTDSTDDVDYGWPDDREEKPNFTLKCYECLDIARRNPNLPFRKLFPRGEPQDAVVIVGGTGYCRGHMPLRPTYV